MLQTSDVNTHKHTQVCAVTQIPFLYTTHLLVHNTTVRTYNRYGGESLDHVDRDGAFFSMFVLPDTLSEETINLWEGPAITSLQQSVATDRLATEYLMTHVRVEH